MLFFAKASNNHKRVKGKSNVKNSRDINWMYVYSWL